MSFWTLVQKNLWRKPLRTTLLPISIGLSFAVYGLLGSFFEGSQGSKGASGDILAVVSPNQTLPMAMKTQLASLPGVAFVTGVTRLRGFVDRQKNAMALSAFDPQALSGIEEFAIPPQLIAALEQARDNVLVGRARMTAQGWSIGQRVTLTAWQTARMDGSRAWPFTIAGVFDGKNANTDTYFMIGRYDYVNAARAHGADTVDMFAVQPQEGTSSSLLATQIDRFFANSATPTKTQSEKQFLEAFLRQYGDISSIADLVASASLVSLLMIVGNSMIFTVRERRGEIGLLKTLGFSHGLLLALIFSETLLLFLSGCAIGLGLAKAASLIADPALGLVLTGAVMAKALALCAVLALVTGALPAFNAIRIPIIAAFHRR